MGGWAKALWVIFVIVVPYLGVFVYLIARGHKMSEHAQQDAGQHEDEKHPITEDRSAPRREDELAGADGQRSEDGARPEDRRILFCDEGGEAPPIADVLRESGPGAWAVLIGPEGGFDPDERALLRARPDVVAVSLGERILRADTAALSALAVWQAIKGDWLA